MPHGHLTARTSPDGLPVRLAWRHDRITDLESAPPDESPPGLWIVPSLLDLQINGYAGVDFQQDNLTLPDVERAARGLQLDGCAQWLLTLITDDWTRLLARLRHLRDLRRQSQSLRRAIVGWHIEGPFLSAEPGFAGAHNPDAMRNPTPADIDALRAAAGEDPVLLTLAPERPGSIEAIRAARCAAMIVSLGHTDANADQLHAATTAGAIGFTHLGNGCPRALDRHDNILWRVFDTPGLTVGLIPDRIHVSPPLFRLVHRVLDPFRIYYTTDAMAAAGAPPGRYRLGRLELDVGSDQVVRQPGSPLFAGSALRPIDGVRRAAEMLRSDWQTVWPSFSVVPAALMGWDAALRVGGPATFCIIQEDDAGRIQTVRTLAGGIEDSMEV